MRAVSNDTRLERAAGRIRDATRQGADIDSILHASADALAHLAPWDAVFLSGADPKTAQFTATRCVKELPVDMCSPWIRNEFLEPDVNKFASLQSTRTTVATLDDATHGHAARSTRYRDIYRPNGFGHELRAALSDSTGCWGYLTLVREHGAPNFHEQEQEFVQRLAPAIASAVRTSHQGTPGILDIAPGVVLVSREGEIAQATDSAQFVLQQLCAASILAVATAAFARVRGSPGPAPMSRVRATEDAWLTIRGDVVRDETGEAVTAVVIIEPSAARDLLPLLTGVYALTPRETEVLRNLARGDTTAQIASSLRLSRYTVRDHISSLFSKVGCRSRGELIHRLFGTDVTLDT
ncbi:MAG TPA: LuxR C-terminal-related transcriptional regulator [Terrimesophilobacter sp.]|nr:LuxR C-terminal-related transcriptional regulator [Terrimesophilobacter sp.]